MEKFLNIAVEAVKESGKLLKSNFNKNIKINSSIDKDIKLQLDLDSEKKIIDILKKHTEFSILSEEMGSCNKFNSEYKWIVDPIDGSLNYSRSIPLCCISIGLWKKKKPILGVVYDFMHDNLYTGIVGGNAKKNNVCIKTSNISDKKNSIICTGVPINSTLNLETIDLLVDNLKKYKKNRFLGSAALSLVLVAEGAVEAYNEENIFIWDVAGAIPIVLAAGGKCKINFSDVKNLLSVYATNGVLNY